MKKDAWLPLIKVLQVDSETFIHLTLRHFLTCFNYFVLTLMVREFWSKGPNDFNAFISRFDFVELHEDRSNYVWDAH